MTVPRMLLWLCLLSIAFSVKTQKGEDKWTVEPFFGTLSGQTVTVTSALWDDGPLTREGQTGPLRPEAAYALTCLQAELPKETLAVERGTGYAADVIISGQEAGGWVLENAWRFGLIVSQETEERLHLRYVGPIHAVAMHALQMDLTEYLLFLRKTGNAALLRNGRAVGWILRVPAGEAVSFILPEGAAWEISGDHDGCVIIAVRSGC
ncbi:MAG: hypothetical protein IKO52_14130 [Clostridia bacterium]|nr:hypothetical protein [Clostridia bacterium]